MDYYKILNLSPDASLAEVKKAFRSLAIKNHPDHCRGCDTAWKKANEKIQEIIEAYETLKDDEKRASYDSSRGLGHFDGRGNFNRDFEDEDWSGWRASARRAKERQREQQARWYATDQDDDDRASYEFDEEEFIRTYRADIPSREEREKLYSTDDKPWMTPAQREIYCQAIENEECWDGQIADRRVFSRPQNANEVEFLIRGMERSDAVYTSDQIAQRVSEILIEHPDYVSTIFKVSPVYYRKLNGDGVTALFATMGALAGKKQATLPDEGFRLIRDRKIYDLVVKAYNDPERYLPKRQASPSRRLGIDEKMRF